MHRYRLWIADYFCIFVIINNPIENQWAIIRLWIADNFCIFVIINNFQGIFESIAIVVNCWQFLYLCNHKQLTIFFSCLHLVVNCWQFLYLCNHKQLIICIIMNINLLYDVLELKKVLFSGRTFLFLKCFWGFWNASL